jgi:NTE family protein
MLGDRKVTVVFGGGGVWGVAWMTGLVKGLAELGLDITTASAFIGTSAGSVVSAQLGSGIPIDDLFDRQVNPDSQRFERAPLPGSLDGLTAILTTSWNDQQERLRALCNLADGADTISADQRRDDITHRLGIESELWPDKPLSITAINIETLNLEVFNSSGGVSLVDAVCASCAVPGVWPPAVVAGRRYIDGGVWRTAENAHLAAGSSVVLILAPLGRIAGGSSQLTDDIERLEKQGAKVAVVAADAQSLPTMMPGPLDPSTRAPGAEAGRLQAAREIDTVRSLFAL